MQCSPLSQLGLSQVGKRLFAWQMSQTRDLDEDRLSLHDHPTCQTLGQLRRTLVADVEGVVVEIGAGTGANFRAYPAGIRWIGIEPNPYMHDDLRQEADRQQMTVDRLETASAEALPLADASADVVVSTHVLCSVSDPDRALQEILRVLKPGGRFVFLEHIAAPDRTWTRRLQNGLSPIWRLLFDGCRVNRTTGAAIARSPFARVESHRFSLDFPVVSPHVAGVAYKA